MHGAADLLILIPAAGAARRMGGRDKLVEDVAGEPVLRRTARLALATGARVLVTLAADRPLTLGRLQALEGSSAGILSLAGADEGLAASLRAGAARAGAARGMMVLLPDMPEVDAVDLCLIIGTFAADPSRPLRGAGPEGEPGHPVILPARLLASVAGLTGDEGARRLLADEEVRLCPLPGRHALTDLDTRRDWALWRKGQAG
ncbi:MAG: NTP transferase domain-containing protein [Proteobacteria bacterium]|nr:NTP transferase domain-containing protein [Pseudomonadota bacterium]MBS0574067.1 NTP transferase domain-containing protein [Pseudomonadota bacterium]